MVEFFEKLSEPKNQLCKGRQEVMKLTVLGAGCWGLTLAWLLTDNFENITVWGRAQDLSSELIENKHCSKPLEVQLDKKVQITSNLAEAIKDADIILSVVATSGTRDVCENLKLAGIKPEQVLVNASKGIELPSLMRMSEVIKDVLPEQKLVILSGPTLAKEVLQGKPTAACVACEDIETAQFVQKACNVPNKFRLYTNTDVIGVEFRRYRCRTWRKFEKRYCDSFRFRAHYGIG